jgi:hypothetical protein
VRGHRPGRGQADPHRLPTEPFTTAFVARLAVSTSNGVQATVGKKDGATAPAGKRLGPRLDAKFSLKFYYVKKRFPIISKCRHMYGVLNVDEIKN